MTAGFTELVDELRLLHNRLVQLASELHCDVDITPPQRAVLEYLHRTGPTTAPGIARARTVTRQHIQTAVNELQRRQMVELQPNPAHQRSPLIALSVVGRRAIEDILVREQHHLATHLADLDEQALRDATHTLAALRNRL